MFRSYWDILQEFTARSGIDFNFYSDFKLNPEHCKLLVEILEGKDLGEKENNVSILRFVSLLWKAVALNKTVLFLGD
jgi:hypothetical protein